MAIELTGADKLMAKLNKISRIESKKVLQEVAADVEEAIKEKASSFSDKEAQYISQAEPRKYGMSCYIDVGLKNENAEFDLWKGLYFHNYGYHNEGLGGIFHGRYMDMHQLWFTDAVNGIQEQALNKIKLKIKHEIRSAMED
jgi:hypothetical protein